MKRLLYLLSACLMTFGFSACNDDDDNLKLQDISVEFAVSEAGMDGENRQPRPENSAALRPRAWT